MDHTKVMKYCSFWYDLSDNEKACVFGDTRIVHVTSQPYRVNISFFNGTRLSTTGHIVRWILHCIVGSSHLVGREDQPHLQRSRRQSITTGHEPINQTNVGFKSRVFIQPRSQIPFSFLTLLFFECRSTLQNSQPARNVIEGNAPNRLQPDFRF